MREDTLLPTPPPRTKFGIMWRLPIRRIHSHKRDIKNMQMLYDMGWNVLVVWECQLKKKYFESTMIQLEKEILNGTTT